MEQFRFVASPDQGFVTVLKHQQSAIGPLQGGFGELALGDVHKCGIPDGIPIFGPARCSPPLQPFDLPLWGENAAFEFEERGVLCCGLAGR